MSGARGAPLPCAVLDKIGDRLADRPRPCAIRHRTLRRHARLTGAASSARGSMCRASSRREPPGDRNPIRRYHAARAALSRAAPVRERGMGDLLRPGADDRPGHRPPRREPARADPRRLGLRQVVAGRGRRPAEARPPVSPPWRAMAHVRDAALRRTASGTSPPNSRARGPVDGLDRGSASPARSTPARLRCLGRRDAQRRRGAPIRAPRPSFEELFRCESR